MRILRIFLALVLTVAFLAFAKRVSKVRSVHETVTSNEITIVHDTVAKEIETKAPVIEATVTGARHVYLFYRIGGAGEFEKIPMSPKPGSRDTYLATMSVQPKGVRAYYYLAADSDGSTVFLPDKNSTGFKPYLLKYEGEVPKLVILLHVLFTFGAIFFGIISLFAAIDVKRGRADISRAIRWPVLTALSMFIGILPSGIAMNHYAFGSTWEAFPFGKDITDNKAQIAFLAWLIVLILFKGTLFDKNEDKNFVSVKGYLPLVAASFILTLTMWAIPHSL